MSSQCTIKFEASEEGGDLATIHYSITITEYKKTSIRKLKVKKKKKGMGARKRQKLRKPVTGPAARAKPVNTR